MKKYISLFNLMVLSIFAYTQGRPNIILIVSDDHAIQTIGAYGAQFGATPNIDKLAQEGMVFNRAFVTNSICAPSRAVMLTGKYSHINGHRDNLSVFNASQDNFGKQLQHIGYQTAWIGKWHLEAHPQGFDYWKVLPGQGLYYNPDFINMDGNRDTIQGYCTDIITNLATKWLDQRDANKPFCMVVGHKATHRTWMPDLQDLGAFDNQEIPIPPNFFDTYEGRIAASRQDMSISKTMRLGYDLKIMDDSLKKTRFYQSMNDAQRKTFFRYYDSLKADYEKRNPKGRELLLWKYERYMRDYLSTSLSLDRNVGRLMNYLEDKGLLDNTLVIYTSDQGFYMGEHGWFDKRFMYEESMRTPLIIRYPKMIKSGSADDMLVQNLDYAPTIVEVAGGKAPADMQGLSLLPLLRGTVKNDVWRKQLYYHYYEYPAEHSVYRHFGIRTERYKLIRFYNAQHYWELYDLKKDPNEMDNLAKNPKYQSVLKKLQSQLRKMVIKVKDDEALQILIMHNNEN